MIRAERELHSSPISACLACGIEASRKSCLFKSGCFVRSCPRCGLGQTYLLDEDAGAAYDMGYYTGQRADGYGNYGGSEPVLRREFRRTLRLLRRFAPSSGSLFEIGAAYGFFLLEARRWYDCSGCDVSEHAVAQAQSRGLDVRRADATTDENLFDGPCSCVVLLDTIEHLAQPDRALALAAQALVPGGCLLLSTGDWGSSLARAMGRRWRLMTPPQHLFFFTRQALFMLIERVGLRVVHCSRPWKVVPLGLAAYQLGSRLGWRVPALESLVTWGVPVNLFDTLLLVARKEP